MRLHLRLASETDKAPRLEELADQSSGMFIPADKAAICAESDCGGVFLYTSGSCPGCGSKQWVLLHPANWFTKAMQDTQRGVR